MLPFLESRYDAVLWALWLLIGAIIPKRLRLPSISEENEGSKGVVTKVLGWSLGSERG